MSAKRLTAYILEITERHPGKGALPESCGHVAKYKVLDNQLQWAASLPRSRPGRGATCGQREGPAIIGTIKRPFHPRLKTACLSNPTTFDRPADYEEKHEVGKTAVSGVPERLLVAFSTSVPSQNVAPSHRQ